MNAILVSILAATLALPTSPALAQPPPTRVDVGRFSDSSLEGWDSRAFKGVTEYAFAFDRGLGKTVLNATARASAAGRFRKIRIDLTRTPVLHWSWKVDQVFDDIDETRKSGDDFPARVYVVVERGVLGLRSISLNYVWASKHAVGAVWPSPYTGQVKLLATQSGHDGLGVWVDNARNLRTDLKAAFGEDIAAIDSVALMTDTDDHKGYATAAYGDIWLSAE